MSAESTVRSPVHHLLEARAARWRVIDDVAFAVELADPVSERSAAEKLAICDLSVLRKFGLKGAGATAWLAAAGIEIPSAVFDSLPLEDGGLVVRFASDEFFLESGPVNGIVSAAAGRLKSNDAARNLHVDHQEGTFFLVGDRSTEVLAQTCGIDFRDVAQRRVVFTRVAGVSCAVFPETRRGIESYRFWIDPSFAEYLWEQLVEITESLEGRVVGAAALYPELLE